MHRPHTTEQLKEKIQLEVTAIPQEMTRRVTSTFWELSTLYMQP